MSMKFLKTAASYWKKVSGNVILKDSDANVGIGTDSPDEELQIGSFTSAQSNFISAKTEGNDVGEYLTGLKLHGHDNTQGFTIQYDARSATSVKALDILTHAGSEAGAVALSIKRTTGAVTKPLQPAFGVAIDSGISIAVDTTVALTLGTVYFDRGGDVTGADVFTAPVTGLYYLAVGIRCDAIPADTTYVNPGIYTPTRNYGSIYKTGIVTTYISFTFSVLADMTAGDTAYPLMYQAGGTASITVNGTNFFGYLAC